MPRKKLEMTHEYPYHIVARSNNKEWFYLPVDQCWAIFAELLIKVNARFSFQTHAFLLMSNHYHLIGTTAEDYPLSKVMEWFQRTANRKINDRVGRINHLFGGPYKASLIRTENYYFHAIKYLYRNPVEAGIAEYVEEYRYSTLRKSKIPISVPKNGIADAIPEDMSAFLKTLNKSYSTEAYSAIRNAINKKEFKLSSRLNRNTNEELQRNQSH